MTAITTPSIGKNTKKAAASVARRVGLMPPATSQQPGGAVDASHIPAAFSTDTGHAGKRAAKTS